MALEKRDFPPDSGNVDTYDLNMKLFSLDLEEEFVGTELTELTDAMFRLKHLLHTVATIRLHLGRRNITEVM